MAAQVPDDQVPVAYRRLVTPHVESFNFFLREGFNSVVEHVRPLEVWRGETDSKACSRGAIEAWKVNLPGIA